MFCLNTSLDKHGISLDSRDNEYKFESPLLFSLLFIILSGKDKAVISPNAFPGISPLYRAPNKYKKSYFHTVKTERLRINN